MFHYSNAVCFTILKDIVFGRNCFFNLIFVCFFLLYRDLLLINKIH